jgi:protocatechuate 3,4-dioxygenase alpha subunit
MSRQTPSQTVGPYFAYGLVPEQYGFDLESAFPTSLMDADDPAARVTLTGCVFDGDGQPLSDAMIEFFIEQDNAATIMCRIGTGTDAHWRYSVALPRPRALGREAPHVDLIVTARGMLLHAVTRIYFDDEAEANAVDATLEAIPAARRGTLIAHTTRPRHYHFDIHLQGARETVFFAL